MCKKCRPLCKKAGSVLIGGLECLYLSKSVGKTGLLQKDTRGGELQTGWARQLRLREGNGGIAATKRGSWGLCPQEMFCRLHPLLWL